MSEYGTVKLEEDCEITQPKELKRKRVVEREEVEECHIKTLEKLYKKIILCVSKPSYVLAVGSYRIRPEHRFRLCHILKKLVRQHNWNEASGVLAVLLKGTGKETHPSINRFKYLVSMEFIKHLDTDVNSMAVNGIFDTWMMRVGINLFNKRKRRGSMKEDSFAVRLESILFRLMHGNTESESQNARSLMQESEIQDHPMFNMIIGLIFSQLCYSTIPQDMHWKDSDQIYSPTHTDKSVTPQLDVSATRFTDEVMGSVGHNTFSSDESEFSFQCNSETSVMNGKVLHKEVMPIAVDATLCRDLPQDFQPQGFNANSAENEASDNDGGHINFTPNLSALRNWNSWLLPLRSENWQSEWVIQNDEYSHALRCLQTAVFSTPPVLAAVIPLIQLLLMKCKYNEALDVLGKFSGNSNAALPARLRAHIVERIDPNNNVMLSTCLENVLKTDPTCRESLDVLISLHQKGNYSPESLVEVIALHLDAVFADHKIWRALALCFLKVFQYEEDCMSVCLHGNEGKKLPGFSVRYNRIPNLFTHGKSGRSWKFRCRWWLTRHFRKNLVASEIAAGNMELLAHKAACAAHMYGPDSDYVMKVFTCIEKESNKNLFMFLRMHMQNSVGINLYFDQRSN